MTNKLIAYTVWKTRQRDDSPTGKDKAGWKRFHHTNQNSSQFKIYERFISEIFHLLFSDPN